MRQGHQSGAILLGQVVLCSAYLSVLCSILFLRVSTSETAAITETAAFYGLHTKMTAFDLLATALKKSGSESMNDMLMNFNKNSTTEIRANNVNT